jgi:hypothetical protein
MQDTQTVQPAPPADAPAAGGAVGDTGAEDALTTLRDEIAVLIDDARTYAEAEAAFQKTRATIAGKTAGRAIVLLVLALVLLHIALIALAVGAVFALAPLVSVWGAMAIVVGAMLAGVVALVLMARKDGALLATLFASDTGTGA